MFSQSRSSNARPNGLRNEIDFICGCLVVMSRGGATDPERAPSLNANSMRSQRGGTSPIAGTFPRRLPRGGAFLNTSCWKVLRLLGADIRDMGVWAPCLYLALESPAAAARHTGLRSFTPLRRCLSCKHPGRVLLRASVYIHRS